MYVLRLTPPLTFRIQDSINRKAKTNKEYKEGMNSRKQRGTPLSPGSKAFWKTQEGYKQVKPNHHKGYQTQLRRPLGPFTATKSTRAGPQYLRICPSTYPARPTAQTGNLKSLDVRASEGKGCAAGEGIEEVAALARTVPVPRTRTRFMMRCKHH